MTEPNPTIDAGDVVAREKIALAAGVALLVAGLVLVTVVLPAEYGVDPLGTGARLGLIELSAAEKNIEAFKASQAAGATAGQPALVPQDRVFKTETVEFKVGPRAFVEYKYRLDKGKALLYSWKATGAVDVDMHAEPDGAPRGYAESFVMKPNQTQDTGTYTAPFSGIHGWYWENKSGQDVTVTLTSAGFYPLSHEFRDGADVKTKTF